MWRMLVCAAVGLALLTASTAVAQQGKDVDHHGKIVKINPDKNTVVISVGEGKTAKEMEYKVGATSKFWGADKQQMTDGLKNKSLKEGTEVWFRTGTGGEAMTINELRLFNPGLPGKGL